MPPKDTQEPQSYVMVIDDHPLFASGIAQFLQQESTFASAEIASNAEESYAIIEKKGIPQMIVMDFWLAQDTCLSLLKELKAKRLATKILVVSADDDVRITQKLEELGVHGFLSKQEKPDLFAQVIQHILKGSVWFPKTQLDSMSVQHKLPITIEELKITIRQGEILKLLLQGFSNKQIAQTLDVTEQTIKDHISIILERLNVKNRVAAITLLQGRTINL